METERANSEAGTQEADTQEAARATWGTWVILWAALLISLAIAWWGSSITEEPARRIILAWAAAVAVVTAVGVIMALQGVGSKAFSFSLPTTSVQWDFKGSWTSTATAASALLTGILQKTGLFNETSTIPQTCTVLSLFFGFLVVFAPILHNAVQFWDNEKKGPFSYIGLYLLASMVIVWAALGQLGTMQYLLGALNPGIISPQVSNLILNTA